MVVRRIPQCRGAAVSPIRRPDPEKSSTRACLPGLPGGVRHIHPFKVQEDFMSTHASPRVGADNRDTRGAIARRSRIRRLSTETKAAFKTTEFFAYLAVLA